MIHAFELLGLHKELPGIEGSRSQIKARNRIHGGRWTARLNCSRRYYIDCGGISSHRTRSVGNRLNQGRTVCGERGRCTSDWLQVASTWT